MPIITVADDNAIEFQLDPTGLQSAPVTSFSASQVVLAGPDGESVVLDGSFGGFDSSNWPTTGTLSAISAGAPGQSPELSITGIVMTIPALRSFINANDNGASFTAALLAGNDTFTGSNTNGDVFNLGQGDDTADGRGGNDTADYRTAASGVTVNLSAAGAQNTIGGGTDTLSNIENLRGSEFNDTLTGASGNNVIEGGAGDDFLDGGDGYDFVSYASATSRVAIFLDAYDARNTQGAGIDTIANFEGVIGSDFNDVIVGRTTGFTTIFAGKGDDEITAFGPGGNYYGGVGNDTLILIAGAGAQTLDGGDGNDVLQFDAGAATNVDLRQGTPQNVFTTGPSISGTVTLVSIENITGGSNADILVGSDIANRLLGNNGNDTLSGLGGDDTLNGGIGDDVIDGGAGNDTLTGDVGTDTVTYANAGAGVTVSLAATSAQDTIGAGVDTLAGFENLTGSVFNDILTGTAGNNIIDGGVGDDIVVGGSGMDTLYGGSGSDTSDYSGALSSVTVSLSAIGGQITGGAGIDTLSGFENLTGSAFDDVLTGDAGGNALGGLDGSDVLYGVAGDDILRDGGETANRDFLYGGSGNDTYYVTSAYAAPNEDLVYEGGTNPDLMAGVGDVDTIHSGGDFFWDYYSVGEVLYIDSSAGSPLLVGGKDVLNKTIYGGAGNDRVVTYGHNSVVDLGAGTDAVDFGPYGLDSSYAGQNTLVMRPGTGIDYIYNFHSGVDHVDLTAFNFGITGAQVLAQAVNVDNPGTANDYSYFYLTNAGGLNNFVVFMGLLGSQLQGGDFLT